MSRRGRATLLIALGVLGVAGCRPPSPRFAVGPLADGVDPFLVTHPLAPGADMRADEVTRTAGASYHVIQARVPEPLHRHRTHDLTVTMLRGCGELVRGAEVIRLRVGDTAVIPRDVPHRFVPGGRGPAVALVVYTPPLDGVDNVPVDEASGRPAD